MLKIILAFRVFFSWRILFKNATSKLTTRLKFTSEKRLSWIFSEPLCMLYVQHVFPRSIWAEYSTNGAHCCSQSSRDPKAANCWLSCLLSDGEICSHCPSSSHQCSQALQKQRLSALQRLGAILGQESQKLQTVQYSKGLITWAYQL